MKKDVIILGLFAAGLLVYPAIFFLWRTRRFGKELGTDGEHVEVMPAIA